jgi:hypothetical protein
MQFCSSVVLQDAGEINEDKNIKMPQAFATSD